MPVPHWYEEAKDSPGGWRPLFRNDSEAVEHAYLNGRTNDPILIDGSFKVVDIATRFITFAYNDDEPAKRLLRGTWFYIDSTSKAAVPFNEEFAGQLDVWFEEIKFLVANGSISCLSGTFKVEKEFRFVLEENR